MPFCVCVCERVKKVVSFISSRIEEMKGQTNTFAEARKIKVCLTHASFRRNWNRYKGTSRSFPQRYKGSTFNDRDFFTLTHCKGCVARLTYSNRKSWFYLLWKKEKTKGSSSSSSFSISQRKTKKNKKKTRKVKGRL